MVVVMVVVVVVVMVASSSGFIILFYFIRLELGRALICYGMEMDYGMDLH